MGKTAKFLFNPVCAARNRGSYQGIQGAILVVSVGLSGCQATNPSVMAAPNQWDGRYSGTSTAMNLGEVRCINTTNKIYIVRNNQIALVVGNSKGAVTIDRDGDFYTHISTLELDGHIKGNVMTVSSSNGNCLFRDVLTRDNSPSSAPAPQVATSLNATSASIPAVTPSPTQPPVPSDVAQRLRSLKSLFDQQLITRAEYETKRKGIVEGL